MSLPLSTPTLPRRALRGALQSVVLALGLALVPVLQAAPDTATPPSGDALSQLLQERELVAPADSSALKAVRDTASDMVLRAMNFLGVPYRRGGNSADEGFDCSGFTRYIFEHTLGLVLPRRADEQAHAAGFKQVSRDELKPGDLVFFNTLRRTFSHVGIYIGDGKFIHAPRTGAHVRVEDMRIAYWTQRFTGARRADTLAAAGTEPAAR